MKGTFFRNQQLRVLCLLVTFSAFSMAEESSQKHDPTFRIVGYMPDYRVEQIDPQTARSLTDVVFFSVNPELNGKFDSKILDSPKTVSLLKRLREQENVRIHLCVGGWDRSKGFAQIAASEVARRKFAKGLTSYCREHGFAGADIDWEHPKDAVESKNYGLLLAEIAEEFKPQGLRLTAAMAAWQTLTKEGIAAVDAIHLMSYDGKGKHSTLEMAEADVRKLLESKIPAKKICLGLPFYGRGVSQPDQVKTYAQIVAADPKSIDKDEADGLYFNGPSTIRAKIRFAKEQKLGGVMIWEIGQDASGNSSLLKIISDEVKK